MGSDKGPVVDETFKYSTGLTTAGAFVCEREREGAEGRMGEDFAPPPSLTAPPPPPFPPSSPQRPPPCWSSMAATSCRRRSSPSASFFEGGATADLRKAG